jgi:monofunctional biosynthetic peptidoglycan transglycosylase
MKRKYKPNRKQRKIRVLKSRLKHYLFITITSVFILSLLLTLPLRWFNPFTTAFIVQEQLQSPKKIQLNWVSYNNISSNVPISVIASEDQKFPTHLGFDFRSLSKALSEDRKKTRGASTITQQLVKNLYLWPGRSIFRKAVEAYFTIFIEVLLPKRRILEIYLNVVEFGPSVYGIDAASRIFFAKQASQINAYQASLLAAVLPNPKVMSAQNPSAYVQKRANDIQRAVKALGGASYLKRM